MSSDLNNYLQRLRASLHLQGGAATAAILVATVSATYSAQVSLAGLTGAALLLFGFLFSPAAFDAITGRHLIDLPSES